MSGPLVEHISGRALDPSRVPYSVRYVAGTVVERIMDALVLRLESPINGVSTTKIKETDLAPGQRIADFQLNQHIERCFIYSLAGGGSGSAGHWFGSLRWALERNNPWNAAHPDYPRLGKIVAGTAIAYGDAHNLVVEISSGINGWLNLTAIPPQGNPPRVYKTIQEAIFLGDSLRAKIIKVDANRCNLELSVREAYEAFRRTCEDAPIPSGTRADLDTTHVIVIDADKNAPNAFNLDAGPKEKPLPWRGRHVLVIENREELAQDLTAWLEAFGADAHHARNAIHARQLLDQHGKIITHILSDYHLGGRSQRASMFTLLRGMRRHYSVALMSGLYDEGNTAANRFGFGFLPKPVMFADLDPWLREGKAPTFDIQRYAVAHYWHHRLNVDGVDRRGTKVLGLLCSRIGADGALWVRRERSHWYRFIAHFGIKAPEEQIKFAESHLGQSLAHDLISVGGEPWRFVAVSGSGPLAHLAPITAHWLAGVPMGSRTDPDGAILFYLPRDAAGATGRLDEFFQYHRETLADFAAWLEDLTTLGDIMDHAREEFDFAALGRASAAILHELRHCLHIFSQDDDMPRLIEKARREEDVDAARKLWRAYWSRGKEAARLIGGGLYSIRADRVRELRLADRMDTIGHHYLWPIAERHKVMIVLHLPPREWVLHLPPEVLDQPLLNLLDNAMYYSRGRPWSRIDVRARLDAGDAAHPVVIEVEDQGIGMTVEQRGRLFSPRVTAKGTKGHGMGLYISQKLVTAVGGELRCTRSERWFGSTFELRLPLALGKPEAHA